MLKFFLFCAVISFVSVFVEPAKIRPTSLPSYIKKCPLDETFKDCFLKNGNEVIPKLIQGDRKFSIPSFIPFILNEVIFEPTSNLKMHFKDLKISGFEDAKILRAKLNKEKSQIAFDLSIPRLDIKANYETKGKILILPFEGSGPCEIILVGGVYKITTTFENMDKDSKGKIKLIDTSVDYTLEKTIYNFENLFNGNKQIGDETNRFLNENHAELYTDFQPAFSKTVETITNSLLSGVLGNLHATDVFNY